MKENLNILLKKLYPKDFSKIINFLSIKLNNQGDNLTKETSDWYHYFNLYITYPNSFEKDNKSDFYSLKNKVKYINKLALILYMFSHFLSHL